MSFAELAAAGRNQVPLGIAYMVGSTAMFAGGNAVVKWQLAPYPPAEVAFGRAPVLIPDRRGDRIVARWVGGRQQHCPILLDAPVVTGAALGGGAVQLSSAGMGMILSFAVCGDVPSTGLLVGSAIVVASGLYILWCRDRTPPPGGPARQRQ
jgi:hypothetical protein